MKDNDLYRAVDHIRASLRESVKERIDKCVSMLSGVNVNDLAGLANVVTDYAVDPPVRAEACWLIGVLQFDDAKDNLLYAVEHDVETPMVWEAAKALSVLDGVTTRLLGVLDNVQDEERRAAVVWALGSVGDRAAVPRLIRFLDDASASPSLRGRAAEALGQCGDKAVSGTLIRALEDDAVEVRFWSAFGLGLLGDRRAIPALERRLPMGEQASAPVARRRAVHRHRRSRRWHLGRLLQPRSAWPNGRAHPRPRGSRACAKQASRPAPEHPFQALDVMLRSILIDAVVG